MSTKHNTKQPEKNDTLTAIQGMKTVALGLDFSSDYDAIRETYHPIEVNQIGRDADEDILVEPLAFDTLTELVDAVKKQKKVTILTKQPSVIEKFCRDNSLEVTIHEWKMGGPSFVLRTKMKNEECLRDPEGSSDPRTGRMKNEGSIGSDNQKINAAKLSLIHEGAEQ